MRRRRSPPGTRCCRPETDTPDSAFEFRFRADKDKRLTLHPAGTILPGNRYGMNVRFDASGAGDARRGCEGGGHRLSRAAPGPHRRVFHLELPAEREDRREERRLPGRDDTDP
ncbi:MAG: hypothetical protein L6W00_05125 [Lentisphaeria bacterium]|nr:MAG: hypothetical protein L6W00_05125 [Lentisphaeria bacterium]